MNECELINKEEKDGKVQEIGKLGKCRDRKKMII